MTKRFSLQSHLAGKNGTFSCLLSRRSYICTACLVSVRPGLDVGYAKGMKHLMLKYLQKCFDYADLKRKFTDSLILWISIRPFCSPDLERTLYIHLYTRVYNFQVCFEFFLHTKGVLTLDWIFSKWKNHFNPYFGRRGKPHSQFLCTYTL